MVKKSIYDVFNGSKERATYQKGIIVIKSCIFATTQPIQMLRRPSIGRPEKI